MIQNRCFLNIECSWFNIIASANKKLHLCLIIYNKNGIYFIFKAKSFLILSLVFVYRFETAQIKIEQN